MGSIVLPGAGDVVPIRASGLAEIFDCSERWVAKNYKGARGPTSGRSHLGTSVHYATSWYDNERVLPDGSPDTEMAIDKFAEIMRDDAKVLWSDIPKQQADNIGRQLVTKYCLEVSHHFDWIKVEATCEPIELTMPNGVIFQVTGHVDRVRRQAVEECAKRSHVPECVCPLGVTDFKTSARIVGADGRLAIDKHGCQLAIYELLEIQASTIIGRRMTLPALVLGFSTTGDLAIIPEEIPHPRSMLFGDGGENEGYLIAASKIIANKLYVGNTYSQLCTPRYCPWYNDCFYIKR